MKVILTGESRGCENGDPEGCFELAGLSMPRKGEPAEPTYVLLERSCEGDFGPGCASLGRVHLQRKTSFDDEIAANLRSKRSSLRSLMSAMS